MKRTLKNINLSSDVDVGKFYDTYCQCTSYFYETKHWRKKLKGHDLCEDCIKKNREEKINQLINDSK